jgi:Na+/H+ antiporter NhaD/arsenite permease-like protein
LALIIIASGILSAIFLNDTIVLVFTPLVLDICVAVNRRPIPYLVALATAANIGSTATITGNPQNMIIGVASAIPFTTFTGYLGPVALASLAVIWIVIVIVYHREFNDGMLCKSEIREAETDPALLRKSVIATTIMLVALVAGMAIPLAALLAASILVVSRRTEPEEIFSEVDWPLLIFFSGLFITTGALETLGVSKQLFAIMQPIAEQGIVALTATGVLLSNLISNVPAVLLFRPFVPEFPAPTQTWLVLAMATTFAGNLTLLGSVANLIVAERAKRKGVVLSFGEYLRAGVPITLLSVIIGMIWLGFIL